MRVAIVGGGPAGLSAAEILSAHTDLDITLYDAKPSVGRKFLVAGKGGLNLTKAEEVEQFASRYRGFFSEQEWKALIQEYTPRDAQKWAAELGIETFIASTRRVYPKEMKAAPLLRRWVERLKSRGVKYFMKSEWRDLCRTSEGQLRLDFQHPEGAFDIEVGAALFALGGASWPETGSNASWLPSFAALDVAVNPFQAANCGWELDWPTPFLAAFEGMPIKNVAVSAMGETASGELMVTRYGLEGGALYQVGAALRAMKEPMLSLDFKPTNTAEQLSKRMGPVQKNFLNEAIARLKLPESVVALVQIYGGPIDSVAALIAALKGLPIPLKRPRPIAEAISSAGGICRSEVDSHLMIKKYPGLFVAGEMLDWEAPTGGYLMQGCFATGKHAAQGLLHYLEEKRLGKTQD